MEHVINVVQLLKIVLIVYHKLYVQHVLVILYYPMVYVHKLKGKVIQYMIKLNLLLNMYHQLN
jgi:hypothetical protein